MVPPVGQVDALVDFAAANPFLAILIALLVGFVFFAYLMVRRTVLGLKEGYDAGRRGE